jgi:hypothetical protein
MAFQRKKPAAIGAKAPAPAPTVKTKSMTGHPITAHWGIEDPSYVGGGFMAGEYDG